MEGPMRPPPPQGGSPPMGPPMNSSMNVSHEVLAFFNILFTVSPIVEGIALTISFVGIFGSILLFITLHRNEVFKDPCFVCYKGVAIAGFFHASARLFMHSYNYINRIYPPLGEAFRRNYGMSWVRFVAMPRSKLCSHDWIIYLIAFLCVQRGVACLLPAKFHHWNKMTLCLGITVFTGVVSSALQIPLMILQDVQFSVDHYVPTPFSTSLSRYNRAIQSLEVVQVPLTLVPAIFAVAGILKAIYLKRKLFNKVNPNAESTKEAEKEAKQNLQLCYLLMIQAVPIVFDVTIFFTGHLVFELDHEPDVLGPNGESLLTYAYGRMGIVSTLSLTEGIANDLHFYLFMIFAKSFRAEFRKRFLKRSSACSVW